MAATTSDTIVAPLVLPIDAIQPIGSREQFILDACRGKTVLHVGCTDAPLTAERLKAGDLLHVGVTKAAKRCIGLDLSRDGIAILAAAGLDNVEYGNAEKMDTAHFRAEGIDLIVAGEVIEHMNNPGLFLEGCAEILKDGGELLITVPNAFAPSRFVHLLLGREVVHKDHVAYYSPKTMTELIRRHGFHVTFLGLTYPYPKRPLLQPWKVLVYALHKARPVFGWSCVFIATMGTPAAAAKRVLG
ncbi:MAG TPA: class I SAM-dependent methyltransferase [Rhizomicrobium sp.]|nr:class I SAM-dependent methyltransferase [Rhizomicrobium sp.]